MKKLMALVVSLLFVVGIAGLSFAAEEKKAEAPAKAEEKKAETKKAHVKVKHVAGEVTAVDAKANTLTVKNKKGEVALSADEKIAAKLADIKAGDNVVVKYKEVDGKNVAISIGKKAEKKAAKKAEKKEAAPAEKPAEKK